MADAKQMARVFMTEMQGAVASDEADPMSRMGRRIKRNWKHGDLKKKTTKVAIGVGVGIITVSASAATGGLALPVILAVAAGTYTVGQLTSGGIAVGWGRQRRGREGTRSWMDAYRAHTPDGQVDKSTGYDAPSSDPTRRRR